MNKRTLELAGISQEASTSILTEASGGKKAGAISMIMANSPVSSNMTKDLFRKALGLAYDAGVDDANKASSKQNS